MTERANYKDVSFVRNESSVAADSNGSGVFKTPDNTNLDESLTECLTGACAMPKLSEIDCENCFSHDAPMYGQAILNNESSGSSSLGARPEMNSTELVTKFLNPFANQILFADHAKRRLATTPPTLLNSSKIGYLP